MKGSGGVWQPDELLVSNIYYGESSIAADASGNVGVAFNNNTNCMGGTLSFIWKIKNSWDNTTMVVDSTIGSGSYCHLAMDSKGSPHISYFRTVGGNEYKDGVTSVLHAYLSPIRTP